MQEEMVVPFLYRNKDLRFTLTVPIFESLVDEVLGRVLQVVDASLTKASIDARELSGVLVAGGTCLIPTVRDRIEGHLGVHVTFAGVDVMWIVAKGAVRHHLDLLSRPSAAVAATLGMDLLLETYASGRIESALLLPAHQTLPCTVHRDFDVNAHTRSLTFQLLVDDVGDSAEPRSLERRVIQVRSATVSRIRVEVRADASRTISIRVTDPRTRSNLGADITIEGDGTLSAAELARHRSEFFLRPVPRRSAVQRYAVGIDLGTTTCEYAYHDIAAGDGEPMRAGRPRPSCVEVDKVEEEGLFVPDDTRQVRQLLTKGRSLFRNFKTWIGKDDDRSRHTDEQGRYWPPHVLAAGLLQALIPGFDPREPSDAPAHLSTEPGAVIAVPCAFDPDRRRLVEQAARLAGISEPVLIDEPIAAFHGHALQNHNLLDAGRKYLILDVGGGTTDVCVLETRVQRPRVLSTAGDDDAGGNLITDKIARCAVDGFLESSGLSVDCGKYAELVRDVWDLAEDAKCSLSDKMNGTL